MDIDAIYVNAPGAQITTSGTSQRVAIPATADGSTLPRYVRIAASAAACVRFGGSSVAATTADTQIMPGDAAVMVVPQGATYIAGIQVAAAGNLQISPIEA